MGFLEVLSLILIVGKLLGFLTISWWVVFTPLLIGLIISLIIITLMFKKRRV